MAAEAKATQAKGKGKQKETTSVEAPASEAVLAAEPIAAASSSSTPRTFSAYSHLLDPRLLRGLSNLGFSHPTSIQAELIPVALGSKTAVGGDQFGVRDVLARARTGSGKTLAYGLVVLQKVLEAKKVSKLAIIETSSTDSDSAVVVS